MKKAFRTTDVMAQSCADLMWEDDNVASYLGMTLKQISPGEAMLSITIADTMTNSHKMCHGGFIYTLADSAFAYACNSHNQKVVALQCSITYVAPAFVGDVLTASAIEKSRAGRGGIYDISVTNQNGDLIAEFRGNSRTIKGTHIPDDEG